MKQRFSSHMTLIELTLSLFFLMLAMVTILGLFTTAYTMSGEAGRLTRATQLAQDCAAVVEGSEDPVSMLLELGYCQEEERVLTLNVNELTVSVVFEMEQTEVGKLLLALVSVKAEDEVLVTMPAARYYNKEVIAL